MTGCHEILRQLLEQQNLVDKLDPQQDDGLALKLETDVGTQSGPKKLNSEQADGRSPHLEQKLARQLGS